MPPRDRKTFPNGRLSGGGHGQSAILELEARGILYNIEHTYPNGVRVGNIPSHASKAKRSGTAQSWFPENWSDADIKDAGQAIWRLSNSVRVDMPSGELWSQVRIMVYLFVLSATLKGEALYSLITQFNHDGLVLI
ncbi:EndoU domain-containing protein [Proteus mirabilis]